MLTTASLISVINSAPLKKVPLVKLLGYQPSSYRAYQRSAYSRTCSKTNLYYKYLEKNLKLL